MNFASVFLFTDEHGCTYVAVAMDLLEAVQAWRADNWASDNWPANVQCVGVVDHVSESCLLRFVSWASQPAEAHGGNVDPVATAGPAGG